MVIGGKFLAFVLESQLLVSFVSILQQSKRSFSHALTAIHITPYECEWETMSFILESLLSPCIKRVKFNLFFCWKHVTPVLPKITWLKIVLTIFVLNLTLTLIILQQFLLLRLRLLIVWEKCDCVCWEIVFAIISKAGKYLFETPII